MMYWRMEVDPAKPSGAVKHTVESLSAGYMGLDFGTRMPNLTTIAQESLPESNKSYWLFANEMRIGDQVLLFTHHFPLELVRVSEITTKLVTLLPRLASGFVTFRRLMMWATMAIL